MKKVKLERTNILLCPRCGYLGTIRCFNCKKVFSKIQKVMCDTEDHYCLKCAKKLEAKQ